MCFLNGRYSLLLEKYYWVENKINRKDVAGLKSEKLQSPD